MRVDFSSVATLALLVCSGSVFAHHGTAGSYDQKKVVTVTGVVKEFRWRNPHSALFIISKDNSGNDVEYVLEMGSPNTLVKSGMTRKMFKPGDEVVVKMHPGLGNPTSGESLTRDGFLLNGKEIKAPEQAARAEY
jgi:Family of unknown function (DUF6152)